MMPVTLALREPSLDDVFLALTGQRTEPSRLTATDGAAIARARRAERGGAKAMTTTTVCRSRRCRASRVAEADASTGPIADTLTLTKRNLIGYTRVPEAVFFSSVQPIMFVLLFRYVFGGAIPTPGYTTCSSSCRASSCRPSPSGRSAPRSVSPRISRRD